MSILIFMGIKVICLLSFLGVPRAFMPDWTEILSNIIKLTNRVRSRIIVINMIK